jgi:steroid delta-isomerase-like uncharacterized protein
MSRANKAVVEKFWDCYNRAAWDELDGLVSEDYVHHNNASQLSLAQFKRGASWVRERMPDYHVVIEAMIAEGDKVVARWVGQGTHQGSLYGETPTGKLVVIYGVLIHQVENNRILVDWEYMDGEYFMREIGALPKEG